MAYTIDLNAGLELPTLTSEAQGITTSQTPTVYKTFEDPHGELVVIKYRPWATVGPDGWTLYNPPENVSLIIPKPERSSIPSLTGEFIRKFGI
jgi:hypothetical protein